MNVAIYKDPVTRLFVIKDVDEGSPSDYVISNIGNLVSVFKTSENIFQVRNLDYSLVTDIDGNFFPDVASTVAYLNLQIVPEQRISADEVNALVAVVQADVDTKAEQGDLDTTNSNVTAIQSEQTAQDVAIALNTAKVSATGNEVDTTDPRLSDARTPLAHTHTKSEITDFDDSDYASAAQGALADTAIQAESDPVFTASEASNFVAGDKTKLDNQSGTNSGDETTSTIQSKRPIKTVGGVTLEGSGDIPVPSAPVDSVNGQTGVVTLGKSDVGLNLVDNTPDSLKPVSTAQQAALDDKVDNSRVLTNVPAGALFTDNDTIYDDTAIQAEVDVNTAKVGITPTQTLAITTNTAKVSATGTELEPGDLKTVNGESLVGLGDIVITGGTGGGIDSDPDPQTNLAGTAVLDDLVLNTTSGEIERFDGTNFVQLTNDAEASGSVAAGSTLGLQQSLLANAGQPGLTVLAVGNTTSGKVQGVSLGDGNVVEVYANGTDFNAGTVLYREFMSLGEPICFTGLSNGAIITSSQGFYGFAEQFLGSNESPMPLLSYGLSFTSTFFFAFRSANSNEGEVYVVNGPLASEVTLTNGSGVVTDGQENIPVEPWGFLQLNTDGVSEYILSSTNPIMACHQTNMDANQFQDARLLMPLTNDGITWPRSGNVSAPFDNTQVEYFTRDNVTGFLNSGTGLGVSPGSPIDFDAAPPIGTGASDQDYEPDGATRVKAIGLISAYSGADSAGNEASPLMPTSAMSQIVAQPLHIDDSGDGGNSGVAIASPFEGTAQVFEWDDATSTLVLAYTVPLTRNGVTITSKQNQNHPASGLVANETANGTVLLIGTLRPGVVIADVPITVVVQNALPTLVPTIRSQNGTTTTSIINDDDETLSLGVTPESIAVEIREGSDGILYKRVIGAGGTETWVVA